MFSVLALEGSSFLKRVIRVDPPLAKKIYKVRKKKPDIHIKFFREDHVCQKSIASLQRDQN